MSSWDHGEALKLKVHGNDYARKVWLAMAPPPGVGGRPREGDDIDVFKRFVVDAYERRRYYREPSSSDGGNDKERGTHIIGAASNEGVALATERSAMPSNAPTINAAPVHTPATASPVVVDLLDFGGFDSRAPQPASAVNSSLPGATSSDAFFDPFNNSTAMPQDVSSLSTTAATANILSSSNNINCKSITNQVNDIMSFNAFAPSFKGPTMASSDSGMQSNNSTYDPFSALAATPAMSTSTWGMMPMNHNGAINFSNHSNMMNGGTSNFANNNMMMMNGGIGMMNSSNAITMNRNNSVMNRSTATGMTGFFNNSLMHNNGANTGVINPTFNGGNMMISNMVMPGNMHQQFHQNHYQHTAIMNTHAAPSMFNNTSISNSFSEGTDGDMKNASASSRSNASTKPDPFAGLTEL